LTFSAFQVADVSYPMHHDLNIELEFLIILYIDIYAGTVLPDFLVDP